MEHASIGAFARFVLQLLAVGAPQDLVLDAQRAMSDETTHARLAFGLASAYAGHDLGPGPLALDGCLEAVDLRTVVSEVFAEGCVGETIAAVEAREALQHVQDPAVHHVLETIAADETRHAELAWHTLAWAIEVGGPGVRDAVAAAIAAAQEQHDVVRDGTTERPSDALVAHGILGRAQQRQLRRSVLAGIVLPCASRLLAPKGAVRSTVAPAV
jgi:hypothetical protein